MHLCTVLDWIPWVLDELLLAHKKYLPQFAEKIAELEAAGVTIKDDVAREITEKGL